MDQSDREHDLLAKAKEVLIETRDESRSYRTVIWVVEGDGNLYVRSFLGDEGAWYQRALREPNVALITDDVRVEFTAVPADDDRSVQRASAGFRNKYPKSRSLDAMLVPEILHTTMRLEPIHS